MTSFLVLIDGNLFITEKSGDVPGPSCTCVAVVNDWLLSNHRTRMGTWVVAKGAVAPTIYCKKSPLDAVLPPAVIPAFCPFCGSRYDWSEQSAPAALSPGVADRLERAEIRLAAAERRISAIERGDAPK